MTTTVNRFVALLLFVFSATTFAESDPKDMLKGVADNIVSYLEKNQDKLQDNPDMAVELVKKELVPYIDQEGLGRRVLAKEWKNASPQQQQKFVEEFVNLVVNTYAKGLAQYEGQSFEFEDTEYNSKETAARVKSVMNQPKGEPVKIDYLLRKPKGLDAWRVIDVRIEGISMASSYRNQFAQQIQKDGLDSVIKKLENNEIELQ
ncbi:MlaC/ttg2D family ABC transporter substrate-binding protein [Pleionea sediminis]|uniref:MlaC/ttg2D family ABC transporter substrate-binding protein n=1 Tax=Pleionea sediminis TaxID=2569479 RepID=UPI001185AC9D|nr:ABC transporter substrate-binding protein [Pleionea sediminis]